MQPRFIQLLHQSKYEILPELNELLEQSFLQDEAIRAGFSQAWRERQYDIIVEIAERMPEAVLQEDHQLLMYYHNASWRQSKKPKQESLL